jgi:hypothetical protein
MIRQSTISHEELVIKFKDDKQFRLQLNNFSNLLFDLNEESDISYEDLLKSSSFQSTLSELNVSLIIYYNKGEEHQREEIFLNHFSHPIQLTLLYVPDNKISYFYNLYKKEYSHICEENLNTSKKCYLIPSEPFLVDHLKKLSKVIINSIETSGEEPGAEIRSLVDELRALVD